MKGLLIVSLALAGFGGAALANQSSEPMPHTTISCSSLSSAALLGCRKPVVPTAQSAGKLYKMLHPKPVNGRAGRNSPRHDRSNLLSGS